MEVCSLLQNRRFCPSVKSAFCLIFEIGGFVSSPKSAVLSCSKISESQKNGIKTYLPKPCFIHFGCSCSIVTFLLELSSCFNISFSSCIIGSRILNNQKDATKKRMCPKKQNFWNRLNTSSIHIHACLSHLIQLSHKMVRLIGIWESRYSEWEHIYLRDVGVKERRRLRSDQQFPWDLKGN